MIHFYENNCVAGTAMVGESILISPPNVPDRRVSHEGVLLDQKGSHSFRQGLTLSYYEVYAPGTFVEVEGTLDEDGVIQVEFMHEADKARVDWRDFIPLAPMDPDRCEKLLERAAAQIGDPEYGTLCDDFLNSVRDLLEDCPLPEDPDNRGLTSSLRHIALELLLLHCLRASFDSNGMGWSQRIDYDLVTAGILLGEAGALGDLEPGKKARVRPDAIGARLRDHAETGAEYVHARGTYERMDPAKNDLLTNAILSHRWIQHPLPLSLEALLLNRIHRLACILEVGAHTLTAADPGTFTEPLPYLDGNCLFHHNNPEL